MKDHLKKCAEILVESGYAEKMSKASAELRKGDPEWHDNFDASHFLKTGSDFNYLVDPYNDNSLESRKQLDVLEDWIRVNKMCLYNESAIGARRLKTWSKGSSHQIRLDRIKFCIDKLTED